MVALRQAQGGAGGAQGGTGDAQGGTGDAQGGAGGAQGGAGGAQGGTGGGAQGGAGAQADKLGLIAGNGVLPLLVARAARARGLQVHAVAHCEETEPALADDVTTLDWVRLGQLGTIVRILRKHGVRQAVLAGGIGRVRAFTQVRLDLSALKLLARVARRGDDALLRGIADHFEAQGISIVSATEVTPEILAPIGHLAGPKLSAAAARDVALGLEVAELLGRADVGQTVVVKDRHVLALEAVEGTDEAVRRGGRLGGEGAVVVKLSKRGQDERFDLPSVGPRTMDIMLEVGAKVLAVEAGKSLLLDAAELFARAHRLKITIVGVERPKVSP